MKNNYNIRTILAAVIVMLITSQIFSQVTETKRYMIVRSTPKYTLNINIDYNQSVLELSGAYNDDFQSVNVYDGQTFGADKGFGANIISKIALNTRGDIRFTQSLSFNRLLSYTFGKKTTVADNGFADYNCYTGGLGLEYNFTPNHKFKIYFGAELNASMINGDMKVWFYYPGTGIPTSDSTYKVTNSFRMGYGLMLGSEYLINDNFGLNIGVRLINANAFMKQAEGTNADTQFKLRDKADPNLRFAGNSNKSFSFYSIMGGINFYFGVKEKRYKLN